MPHRLEVDSGGRLVSPDGYFTITYADPWPARDGTPGGFAEPAAGHVVHTEVGYEHTAIQEFEDPAAQASAFTSIAGGFADIADGNIHQYGPLFHGWMAWTQKDANPKWRGHETEDGGDDTRPMTQRQLEAHAALLELEWRYDGFPHRLCDHDGSGLTGHCHYPSGQPDPAWGDHPCPGTVRLQQLPTILQLAEAIAAGAQPSEGLMMYSRDHKDGSVVFTDPTGATFNFNADGSPGGHFLGNLDNHPAYNAGEGKAEGPCVGVTHWDDGLRPFCGIILWTRDAGGAFHAYNFPSDARHAGTNQIEEPATA